MCRDIWTNISGLRPQIDGLKYMLFSTLHARQAIARPEGFSGCFLVLMFFHPKSKIGNPELESPHPRAFSTVSHTVFRTFILAYCLEFASTTVQGA